MDTYSLNPQILPQVPMKKEEHHHYIRTGIFAALAAILIGLIYWWAWSGRQAPAQPADPEAELRARVISLLNSTPVTPASPEEVEGIVKQLSAKPAAAPTEEQRASIIQKLNAR